MQASRDSAFDFYRRHGMPESRIDSHLDGIDFRHPVEVRTIPRGTILSQYQVQGGQQGSYYSNGGTTASELGINPQGQVLGPDGRPIIGADGNPVIADKVVTRWEVTEDIQVLQSTAAPISDTWSVPGQPYNASGGGIQMYMPDRSKFRPIIDPPPGGPTPGGPTPGGPSGGPTPGGPTPGGPTPGGPTPDSPGSSAIVTERPVQIGGETHTLKVRRNPDGSHDIWLCSDCGVIRSKVEQVLTTLPNTPENRATRAQLERIHAEVTRLENGLADGSITPGSETASLDQIGQELRDLARNNPSIDPLCVFCAFDPSHAAPLTPSTVDATVRDLKSSGMVTGDMARLDHTAKDAAAGDPGALGELEAIRRWVSEGRRVEVPQELQNVRNPDGTTRKNPDYLVDGQLTEVKSRSERMSKRWIKDRISESSAQFKQSESGNPGNLELQLRGEEAGASLADIDQQIRGAFTADRGTGLDRVTVYHDGVKISEWVRERSPDGGPGTTRQVFP